MNNWFIFGAGFSGREAGRQIAAKGLPVAGTTRSAAKAEFLQGAGIKPLVFDGTLTPQILASLEKATHLLMSIGPDDNGDPLLPQLSGELSAAMPKLEWIGYLSTVGVYGDHKGAWVDETSLCLPSNRRSQDRLKAEAAWQGFAQDRKVPLAILRLSGIYGPGRNAFCNLEDGSAKRIIRKGQVFNRIHIDDIAGAVQHLAAKGLGGIFNVSDNEPAPPQDVVTFAAEMMGVQPPPEIDYDSATLSPMARSFYGEVKRVSNKKLTDSGYQFRQPDYRRAFTQMWQSGAWR